MGVGGEGASVHENVGAVVGVGGGVVVEERGIQAHLDAAGVVGEGVLLEHEGGITGLEIKTGASIMLERGAAQHQIACAHLEQTGVVLVSGIRDPRMVEGGRAGVAHYDAAPPVGCFRAAGEHDGRPGHTRCLQGAVHVKPLISGELHPHPGFNGQRYAGADRDVSGHLVRASRQGPRGIGVDRA